jgi:hypothetical protein
MALCSVGGARNDGTIAVTCCGTATARNVTSLQRTAATCNAAMLWCYGAAAHCYVLYALWRYSSRRENVAMMARGA